MTILLDNVNTNVTSETQTSNGGSYMLVVRASDFGGATVEFKVAAPSDTVNRFDTLPSGTFITNGTVKIDYLSAGVKFQAVVSGTTGSSDGIFAEILQQ
jgi:hypothetical protein